MQTFDDEFSSLSLHRTWQPGDKWQLIAPDSTDGRGGPAWNESGSQWWVNPYNPDTPCNGVYRISNGKLQLGILPTPSSYQAYIDQQAGAHRPYIGALLNTSQTDYQRYGYYELSAAVDRVPGFDFHADTENVQLTGHWPPEIDFDIYTDASDVQHVTFQVATGSGESSYTISSNSDFDARSYHTYGWNWQSNYIAFYIDGTQVWKTANPGGVYTTDKEFLYIGTYANYPDGVDPNPASLPAYANLDYVRVYQNTPTASAPGVVLTPTSGGSVTDANGNVWSLTSAGNIDENGKAVPGGGGTAEMERYNGQIYAQDASSGGWYVWKQQTWSAVSAPPSGGSSGGSSSPPPASSFPSPSSGGTTIITPGSGSFTDTAGNTYTLSAAGAAMENGSPILGGSGTAEMELNNGQVYGQDASSGGWYVWNQQTWSAASAPPSGGSSGGQPPPAPSTINLTATGQATENVSDTTIAATSGNHALFLGGSHDTINLLGGADRLVETSGGSNTLVIPPAGGGTLAMGSDILTNGDTLDLRQALADGSWTGDASTLSNFVHVNDTTQGNTNIGIDPSGTPGPGHTTFVASIVGVQASATTVFAHALT